MKNGILITLLLLVKFSPAQTWVDSLDRYAREKYLPAKNYKWQWTHAALLSTMVEEYKMRPAEQKQVYLDYVKQAIGKSVPSANGRTPNAVASALGLAFLYKQTHEEKYKTAADKIYRQYINIHRTKDGAVSHLMLFRELWDDTIFMIGEFLLNMYQTTGDEKYLDEFMQQFRQHRQQLQDSETGLWVHGWDSKHWGHCMFCSQIGWADKQHGTSSEIWGRGNGWIVVTLSDALEIIPHEDKRFDECAAYLKEMIKHLPELQDKQTGHWYQLPVRNTDTANWIESSCTAMFAYGINTALRLKLVNRSEEHTSELQS